MEEQKKEKEYTKIIKYQMFVNDEAKPEEYELKVFKYNKKGQSIGHQMIDGLSTLELTKLKEYISLYEIK